MEATPPENSTYSSFECRPGRASPALVLETKLDLLSLVGGSAGGAPAVLLPACNMLSPCSAGCTPCMHQHSLISACHLAPRFSEQHPLAPQIARTHYLPACACHPSRCLAKPSFPKLCSLYISTQPHPSTHFPRRIRTGSTANHSARLIALPFNPHISPCTFLPEYSHNVRCMFPEICELACSPHRQQPAGQLHREGGAGAPHRQQPGGQIAPPSERGEARGRKGGVHAA